MSELIFPGSWKEAAGPVAPRVVQRGLFRPRATPVPATAGLIPSPVANPKALAGLAQAPAPAPAPAASARPHGVIMQPAERLEARRTQQRSQPPGGGAPAAPGGTPGTLSRVSTMKARAPTEFERAPTGVALPENIPHPGGKASVSGFNVPPLAPGEKPSPASGFKDPLAGITSEQNWAAQFQSRHGRAPTAQEVGQLAIKHRGDELSRVQQLQSSPVGVSRQWLADKEVGQLYPAHQPPTNPIEQAIHEPHQQFIHGKPQGSFNPTTEVVKRLRALGHNVPAAAGENLRSIREYAGTLGVSPDRYRSLAEGYKFSALKFAKLKMESKFLPLKTRMGKKNVLDKKAELEDLLAYGEKLAGPNCGCKSCKAKHAKKA